LSPSTEEELVEWVFLHPNKHPSELAEAALAAKMMPPVFSNSLTQQVNHIFRVMIHFSRLLLLAHNQSQQEGAKGGPEHAVLFLPVCDARHYPSRPQVKQKG